MGIQTLIERQRSRSRLRAFYRDIEAAAPALTESQAAALARWKQDHLLRPGSYWPGWETIVGRERPD